VRGAAATVGAGYRTWLAKPRFAAVTALRRRLRRVAERYRRSLQLRVVTATLILSAVVVSVLGYLLMQHLVTGIYAGMEETSQSIASTGLGAAEKSTQFNQPNQASSQAMWSLAQSLASPGGRISAPGRPPGPG